MTMTLTIRSDQPAEQRASHHPTARAPVGVDACTPSTIATVVKRIIPVLTKAAAASFVILTVVFIKDDDHIHRIILR